MLNKPAQLYPKAVVLCLLLTALPLQAKTAPEELMAYMEGLEGLRSNFEQNVYANGLIVESSTGSMALAKPKLRWQVNAPFPQIIIVSPGRVEIYDPDLSQLTIQETGSNQTETPASLLMNPGRLLSSRYQVNQVGSQNIRVFQLTPKGSAALFQRLEITFEKGTLKSLQILDWQQQQTEIRFENVVVNQDLPPTLFQLAVPEGTDVIRG